MVYLQRTARNQWLSEHHTSVVQQVPGGYVVRSIQHQVVWPQNVQSIGAVQLFFVRVDSNSRIQPTNKNQTM